MASAHIEAHILRLEATQVFTTRDVLQYGCRGAVDTCLYRMVKTGFIVRLARGVFVRDPRKQPSIQEIARIKAVSFGRRIFSHATEILKKLGILKAEKAVKARYAIDGHSSSFMTYRGRVRFQGIAPRKAKLCEMAVGKRVYALWHQVAASSIERAVNTATRDLNRFQRSELRRSSALMPAWLHHLCMRRYARFRET
jgi:hypothetical protein